MSLGELREAAIIATIIDRVSGASRFCGETFLQKSAFFLKELFGVPLTPKFRLYHYGPFSFDLRDQLRSMEADDVVRIRPHEFGATYVAGDRYSMLQRQFPKTLAETIGRSTSSFASSRPKASRISRRWQRRSMSRRRTPARASTCARKSCTRSSLTWTWSVRVQAWRRSTSGSRQWADWRCN